MYYEIYIDSILLLNFVMNLYCLELVNRMLIITAAGRKILMGAALGAFIYLFPFLIPGLGWLKAVIFFPVSMVGMIWVVFRPEHVKAFWYVARLMLATSFLLGGVLIFVLRIMPGEKKQDALWIMGVGGLVVLEVSQLIKRERQSELCLVELIGKGAKIKVNALVDTGNQLIEPVSGKPVCILEKDVFEGLWRSGGPAGFRVIPYHSLGKKQGILYGYLVPEIRISKQGLVKSCKDIYIGIVEGQISKSGGYCMILNPRLLHEGVIAQKRGKILEVFNDYKNSNPG